MTPVSAPVSLVKMLVTSFNWAHRWVDGGGCKLRSDIMAAWIMFPGRISYVELHLNSTWESYGGGGFIFIPLSPQAGCFQVVRSSRDKSGTPPGDVFKLDTNAPLDLTMD